MKILIVNVEALLVRMVIISLRVHCKNSLFLIPNNLKS